MSRPDYRIDDRPPADVDLIPIERDPITGRRTGFDRDRKHRRHDRPPDPTGDARPPAPGRSRTPGTRRTWAITGAAAGAAAIIVGAVLLTRGGSPTPQAATLAPTTVRTSSAPPITAVTGTATAAVAAPHSVPGTSGSSGRTSARTSAAPGPSSSGGVAPRRSATSSAAPTAPIGPAYLDPARLVGYQEILTLDVSRVVTVTKFQGSVSRWDLSCVKGTCELADPATKFAVGAPRISSRIVDSSSDGSACMPWTQTLDLTLTPATGIYHGTYAVIPRAEKALHCEASLQKSSIELVPIIKPDLGSVPANTPAALNPARIAGYHGTMTTASKAQPVTVSCGAGICVLPCAPLCNGTVRVAAAADTWTPDDMQPDFTTCGKGTTTISLARSADGGYAGTVNASYAGKVDPKKCPTTMTFTLQPTLS